MASDVLTDRYFQGRVVDYETQADGKITAVRLDNEPGLPSEDAWASISDLSAIEDMSLIGATYALAIRRKGETTTTHAITVSTLGADWVDLVTPATLAGLDYGDIAATGPLGKEYRRLIVIDMAPRSLTEWTITAVSEAPELWQ